jgi:hypothetical protein
MIQTVAMDERRRLPRTDIALPCTLSRRSGTAINAETINLGPGGMRISSPRPLALDEVLSFDLPLQDSRVDGRARVLRQEGVRAYALRFEGLAEPAREQLLRLAGA